MLKTNNYWHLKVTTIVYWWMKPTDTDYLNFSLFWNLIICGVLNFIQSYCLILTIHVCNSPCFDVFKFWYFFLLSFAFWCFHIIWILLRRKCTLWSHGTVNSNWKFLHTQLPNFCVEEQEEGITGRKGVWVCYHIH